MRLRSDYDINEQDGMLSVNPDSGYLGMNDASSATADYSDGLGFVCEIDLPTPTGSPSSTTPPAPTPTPTPAPELCKVALNRALPDGDQDGISNHCDMCAGTTRKSTVDSSGCAQRQGMGSVCIASGIGNVTNACQWKAWLL